MKKLALISVSLLVVGCGTVVGNGRSGSDRKDFSTDTPTSAKDNAAPVPGSNTGTEGAEYPPAQPESSPGLLEHFLVPCASPFATAGSDSYSSPSGTISISESLGTLVLSGDISASIRVLGTSSSPYAIERLNQSSLNLTCETSVETPLDEETTQVAITFSDGVSIEWVYDASHLLSFKVVSADAAPSIEYTRDEAD